MAKRDDQPRLYVVSGDGQKIAKEEVTTHILTETGGGGGPMEPITSKDYTDAKCAELRAETRADLAEIKSLIETRMARIDKLPTLWQLVSAVGAASAVTITLLLAIMAYTGDRVDTAAQLASIAGASIQRMEANSDANAKSIQRIEEAQDRLRGARPK